MRSLWIMMLCFSWILRANSVKAEQHVLEAKLKHLRIGTQREWADFPKQPDTESLVLKFDSYKNQTEQTLRLRQQDVKQTWRVLLNGKELGRLHRNENDMHVNWPIPVGSLVDGENTLTIQQSSRLTFSDDVRVGEIVLDDRPLKEVLSEAAVQITIMDAGSNQPTPCRLTVLDTQGTLVSVGAISNHHMAVRPGVIYSGDGNATFGLPAGRYTIYAGRGFEYGIDSVQLTVKKGETASHTLNIQREVPAEGWISCDTHVHTLTHSGHGDASMEERMLTLAGEGIELPIATDHNKHIDYEAIAKKMGVRQYFTPIIGNEVSTKVGHFNIFPVKVGAPIPNYRLTDWRKIADEIFKTPDVKVAILNHSRDIHSGFRPFGPKRHNGLIGKNLDGWKLRANAMELINSGAQQTDVMQPYRDWFGLLNRGVILTPVGCSDSHDVARHFVGQARTYIRCKDSHLQKIDINEAVENFAAGRVMVSCGLLAEMTVEGKYGPGELVPVTGEVSVSVRVLGPSWSTAEVVELYQNGRKIREQNITKGTTPGVKWSGTWTLPRPKHDVYLVAVARGPGVKELYWPIAKPYQPTSPVLESQVVGSSGAVWLDADGNAMRNSAFDYAKQIVQQENYHPKDVLKKLGKYDQSVAAQTAGLLQEHGVSLTDKAFKAELNTSKLQVQQGIQSYLQAWRETQRARLER
jgi:hypothetical protein